MHIHIKHTCTKSNKGFVYLRYLMAIKAFHLTGLAKEFRGSSFIKSWNTHTHTKEVIHFRKTWVFGCLGSEDSRDVLHGNAECHHFYMKYQSLLSFFLCTHQHKTDQHLLVGKLELVVLSVLDGDANLCDASCETHLQIHVLKRNEPR